MAKLAFLGTGLLGGAFTEAAAKRGDTVVAWNRSKEKAQALAPFGVVAAATPAAAVVGAARVHLILRDDAVVDEVIAAADLLKADWGVEADIWGCPSFNELARDGQDTARWNMLHPLEAPKLSHVEQKLAGAEGPVVAATDYIKLFAEQIRPFVKNTYITLGTDGFGRSDTREKLRHHFEVDRHWVTLAALKALADEGKIEREKVAAALVKYNLDPAKPNPMSV